MDILLDGESAKEQGLQLSRRPDIPVANMVYETVSVPGRDGQLTIPLGYNSVSITLQYNFIENVEETARKPIRKALNWLTGKKQLEFSDDPGFYRIIQEESIQPVVNDLKGYAGFEVNYVLEPFWYEEAGTETISSGTVITNPSSVPAPILMRVYGQGTIVVAVNGEEFTLKNVVDWLDVDGISKNATKNGITQNENMIGDFPELQPGDNTITFEDADKIELTKRWCWR